MAAKARFNLESPNGLRQPVRLDALSAWFADECEAIPEADVRHVLMHVGGKLDVFTRWPSRALLLWPDFVRKKKQYPRYPEWIRVVAKAGGVKLDTRINGPAVAAFTIAGGARPKRYGSTNAWTIHHIYSGKFPHPGKTSTLRSAADGRHCTQSAGLVAIHPIADQLCDEYPAFAWLLRAEAFRRFGYDPDAVFFEGRHDKWGFVPGKTPKLLPRAKLSGPSPGVGARIRARSSRSPRWPAATSRSPCSRPDTRTDLPPAPPPAGRSRAG